MSGFLWIRRPRRWPILLAALPLLAVLLLAMIAYARGVRVQGLDWRDGLVVVDWQWRQNDCEAVRGEQLRVIGWRPVTLAMARLTLTDCHAPGTKLDQNLADTIAARLKAGVLLPWTPAFHLTVEQLSVSDWPPLAMTVSQEAQRWQARARHQDSEATVAYDHASGDWTARGELRAEEILPDLRGRLHFEGHGRWLAGQFEGALQVLGRQLGYQDQPQRADATFEIQRCRSTMATSGGVGGAAGSGRRLAN